MDRIKYFHWQSHFLCKYAAAYKKFDCGPSAGLEYMYRRVESKVCSLCDLLSYHTKEANPESNLVFKRFIEARIARIAKLEWETGKRDLKRNEVRNNLLNRAVNRLHDDTVSKYLLLAYLNYSTDKFESAVSASNKARQMAWKTFCQASVKDGNVFWHYRLLMLIYDLRWRLLRHYMPSEKLEREAEEVYMKSAELYVKCGREDFHSLLKLRNMAAINLYHLGLVDDSRSYLKERHRKLLSQLKDSSNYLIRQKSAMLLRGKSLTRFDY